MDKRIINNIPRPQRTITVSRLLTRGGATTNSCLLTMIVTIFLTRKLAGAWAGIRIWAFAQCGIHGIKIILHRERPDMTGYYPALDLPALPYSWSMPSGHAASSALLAGLAYKNNEPLCFITLVWSFAVGISRIILGAHYPSDVAAGWIVGFYMGRYYDIISR